MLDFWLLCFIFACFFHSHKMTNFYFTSNSKFVPFTYHLLRFLFVNNIKSYKINKSYQKKYLWHQMRLFLLTPNMENWSPVFRFAQSTEMTNTTVSWQTIYPLAQPALSSTALCHTLFLQIDYAAAAVLDYSAFCFSFLSPTAHQRNNSVTEL